MRVSVPRVQNLGKWPFLMGPNRTRTNCELRKPSLHPHFPGVASAPLWPLLCVLGGLAGGQRAECCA